MTQDDVIRLAREIASYLASRMCDENGETHGEELYCMAFDDIVDAVKLVAEHERNEILKMCEPPEHSHQFVHTFKKLIRARGQA